MVLFKKIYEKFNL